MIHSSTLSIQAAMRKFHHDATGSPNDHHEDRTATATMAAAGTAELARRDVHAVIRPAPAAR